MINILVTPDGKRCATKLVWDVENLQYEHIIEHLGLIQLSTIRMKSYLKLLKLQMVIMI